MSTSRLRELSEELRTLEARLREGGGKERIEKQHAQGKLTARQRVRDLCDEGARFIEIGLLVAYAALTTGSVWLRSHPLRALFGIGAAALLLLFIGIHNAWDTTTWVITQKMGSRETPGDAS